MNSNKLGESEDILNKPTMAPPTPIPCSFPECTYTTPAGCPSWDLITKQLELHASTVHPPHAGGGRAAQTSHHAKLESLPRPKFSLNMTEGKRQFINMQWTAYIDQTPASDTQKVEQLRAACDKDLLQRVYDSGSFSSLNTVALLLDKMKELAVIKVHKTIHMVHMWRMAQESSETIRAFAARITGKANLCEMNVPCPTLN